MKLHKMVTVGLLAATVSTPAMARSLMDSFYRSYNNARMMGTPEGHRQTQQQYRDDLQEEQIEELKALRQELQELQNSPAITCDRGRGQVPSASIHCN